MNDDLEARKLAFSSASVEVWFLPLSQTEKLITQYVLQMTKPPHKTGLTELELKDLCEFVSANRQTVSKALFGLMTQGIVKIHYPSDDPKQPFVPEKFSLSVDPAEVRNALESHYLRLQARARGIPGYEGYEG